MKILTSYNQQILTIDDWALKCPPASKKHWVAGRSAMETAKVWLNGPPKEFLHLFGNDITVEQVYPEHKSKFDTYKGNTRNHDLLIIGKNTKGKKIVVCVESKVDESFGKTLHSQIKGAEKALKSNERSKAKQRIEDLRIALFGELSDKQLNLRYQLITAIAGAITEAEKQGVEKVYFVVQTFLSGKLNFENHKVNQQDLDSFIEQLSKSQYRNIQNNSIVGPCRVPGNNYINKNIDLYLCKIEI